MSTVAIIGAGISGIACARACLEAGLSPTLFDKRATVGGIWSGEADTPIFTNLITNTPTFETCYSDLPPTRTTANESMYPGDNLFYYNQELTTYLTKAVNNTANLRSCLRLSTTVESILRADKDTWVVVSQQKDGSTPLRESFDKVIIAAGFFHTPQLDPIHNLPGAKEFCEKWMHVSQYRTPSQFKGMKVLVVGGSLSGCEAAADLAHAIGEDGPESVTLVSRICRQVFDKLHNNRPFLSKISTRFHYLRTLAGRYGVAEYEADMQKEVDLFQKNEDYGAPAADGSLKMDYFPRWSLTNWRFFKAFEDARLQWKIGSLKKILQNGVQFNDGNIEDFDRIIFATGYKLELPYLEEEIHKMILQPDAMGLLDLYEYTFHPELNGLAFVGMHPPGTTTISAVDGQARWVTNVFSGRVTKPSKQVMEQGIKQYIKQRKDPESHFVVFNYEIIDRVAKHGGFEVDLAQFPELSKGLIFGPLVPAQFRMCGVGKIEQARMECEKQLEAGGFRKGEYKIDKEQLDELIEVWNVLKDRDDCPKGLGEAVQVLIKENESS